MISHKHLTLLFRFLVILYSVLLGVNAHRLDMYVSSLLGMQLLMVIVLALQTSKTIAIPADPKDDKANHRDA